MGKRYTFVVSGLDIDQKDIEAKVERAAARYAERKGIVHYAILDWFNDENGVRVNLEDVSE